MRFWNASIFARGARETATNVVSRCCRCTRIPSTLSASIEQLGQPSSHSGPSMKWYTASWLRPSNRSASVSLPFGPSKTYGFSIFTQGSAPRSRASSSRCRVPPGLREEMGSHRPVGLRGRHLTDLVEPHEGGDGTLDLRERGRPADPRADRGRQAYQMVVEERDRAPVDGAPACPRCMGG